MQKENLVPVAFKFNVTHQEVRSFLINKEPWFVAKDICDILGLKNSRLATATLDTDEKGVCKTYTLSGKGGLQNTTIVSESGLYALILRSNKKEARIFRKWVTSEVLPAIRKKGHYGVTNYSKGTFIDLRDVPFTNQQINGSTVRKIVTNQQDWYSLADIHRCIGSQTSVTQAAKRLNLKQTLAQKMWLFGATHPAWFTNQLGLELIVGASRVFARNLKISQA